MAEFRLARPIRLALAGLSAISAPSGVTIVSTPPPPPPPPPDPSAPIAQYLTSDGGTAAYQDSNFSGPTQSWWHNRLRFGWKRGIPGSAWDGQGDWTDSNQTAQGSAQYARSVAITAVDQTVTMSVTALVSRWQMGLRNKGFYLKTGGAGSSWPVLFYGRGNATAAKRPTLTISTELFSYTLYAQANACWPATSFVGIPSKNEFQLAAGSYQAILRFDMTGVVGIVTSATLSVTVSAFGTPGQVGQQIDVLEADPPVFTIPDAPTVPVEGRLATYANWPAWKASGDSTKVFADDFATPEPWRGSGGWWSPAATYSVDADGTTRARGTLLAGENLSLSARYDAMLGTGTGGTPNVVIPELYGQYFLTLESDFGSVSDSEIKLPAMGVQFGYWNPASGGYWQQTTGNGGAVGTGLKVAPYSGTGGNFDYQGHSIRILTGAEPVSGDDDPYRGIFGLKFYPYNLDQPGAFPAGEPWPYVAIRRGREYCIDLRVKQNSMSGAQDVLGNYATANADGILQAWINGHLAYSKTTFRWRKHAEFGVQGIWLDVYHGGTLVSPTTMHYQLAKVSLSTSYIGPPKYALPTWMPAAGEVATLTVANGKLSNSLRDTLAPYYDPFYSVKIANSYGSGTKNKYIGTYGGSMIHSGGHSNTNDNSVAVLEYGAAQMTFKRLTDPVPWFGSGTDATTKGNNGISNINTMLDWIGVPEASDGRLQYGEATGFTGADARFNGQPGASHTYGIGVIVGPEHGGAAMGTLVHVQRPAVGAANFKGTVACHTIDIQDTTSATTTRQWRRHTNQRRDEALFFSAPAFCVYEPNYHRVHHISRGNTTGQFWYDLAKGNWIQGTGTAFNLNGSSVVGGDAEGGCAFIVPTRSLLICAYPDSSNNVKIQYADYSVAQPTLGGTATLSQTLSTLTLLTDPDPSRSNWGGATWCPHNNRIILMAVDRDDAAAYEVTIPTVLTDTWTVTRAPYGSGQTFYPNWHTTHQKLQYDEKLRGIVFYGRAYSSGTGEDEVRVYRPRNT